MLKTFLLIIVWTQLVRYTGESLLRLWFRIQGEDSLEEHEFLFGFAAWAFVGTILAITI